MWKNHAINFLFLQISSFKKLGKLLFISNKSKSIMCVCNRILFKEKHNRKTLHQHQNKKIKS